MIYQLRSGSIVYQSGALSNALDGPCRRNLTQLDEMMRKTFTSDIEQQSGVGGKAMCCKSNACNAAIPKVTKNLLCSSLPSFLCACTYFRPFLLCSYAETYLHISSLLSPPNCRKSHLCGRSEPCSLYFKNVSDNDGKPKQLLHLH